MVINAKGFNQTHLFLDSSTENSPPTALALGYFIFEAQRFNISAATPTQYELGKT